ncbi:Sec23-binding domain of Sec16-domain-containing protein [Mucor lusitanicus]|uniref:Protein transport protein sec16 n=1 Tax=Mucor lusitanicus CBS 277.49 TaxID=747725 RepID=A0A168LEI5_MUCCL|nr:hypothetical protein MUCCIDRAFT_189629 [Mucor lusitanicus CBS 277.49]
MTTPYSEPLQQQQQQQQQHHQHQQQAEWYQFDPNVHYYYDEQGQLHYYDPNTNLECDYQPHYVDDNAYYTNTSTSTPQSTYTHPQQQPAVSRQATPDVLLPCPEPTCHGENKPTSKFCEECGRQLGAISRSVTPAIVNTPVGSNNNNNIHNSNVSALTRSFANHQVQDYHPQQQQSYQGYTQPPLQRPPTAPVYSTSPLDSSQTVPLYHPPSVGSTVDNVRQQHAHLYYNGVQHQSMQDLYGQAQQQQYQANYQAPVQQPAVDSLDRARGCPIVCFGFGGKMLVTFPRTVTNYYSSTVKPQPGPIKITSLKELGPRVFPIPFPGPVLYDSKIGTKQKKKDVAQYMAHRVDAFEKEKLAVVYNSLEFHQLEAKILLWQLVKVMVENDGAVNDKGKMDQAILSVLRPTVTDVEESHFALPAFNNSSNSNNANQQQPSSVDLSDQVLSKIEHYLLNGDRIGAVDYAIQEDLWAHALIISSCVDKDLWQKVIKNFVDREMNCTPEMRQNRQFNNIAGNNQALRVIYSLFSGAGATAIHEFLANDVQHINTPYGLQAVTPQADVSQLVKWRDTVAIILANRTGRDLEALTAFGDMMKEQGWIEAAHICYLLSPPCAVHAGIDTMQVRLTLIGSDRASIDAYNLTEIFEFATSTTTCLPFLQGYKLAHAWILADFGYMDQAQRYYDAIDQCIKSYTKGSPYLHPHLIEQVNALGVFLENATGRKSGDPGSWLKPKFQKKAFSSLWGTLEGSLTKFVSGEEVPTVETVPARKSTEIMSRYQ